MQVTHRSSSMSKVKYISLIMQECKYLTFSSSYNRVFMQICRCISKRKLTFNETLKFIRI